MNKIRFSALVAALALTFSACLKQNFDYPPDTSTLDPNLPVNATISNIRSAGSSLQSGQFRKMGDTTIAGIVVADDRSGNFYKKLIIQDTSNGGIILLLDKTYLYADYPIGRKIYVNLNGLLIGNDKGLPTIAYTVDAIGSQGIPSALIKNYVTKASYPNEVKYRKVTLEDIAGNASSYINTLVELKDVQFAAGSNNVNYAAPSAQSSGTNRTLQDCIRSATIIMYNSGYANFQAAITPNGSGSVLGVYSTYNTTPQLLIRDTTDVRLINGRTCP